MSVTQEQHDELKRQYDDLKRQNDQLQRQLDIVIRELVVLNGQKPKKTKKSTSNLQNNNKKQNKKKDKQAKKNTNKKRTKSNSKPVPNQTSFCLDSNIQIDEIRTLEVTEEQVKQSNCSCTIEDYYCVSSQDETIHRVWIPGHFKIIKCEHKKKKCKCGQSYLRAITPTDLKMNSSTFDPAFHSQVCVDRILNAMPLYRQMKHFKRLGYSISKQTLGNILHRSAHLISKIATEIKGQVRQATVLLLDGTSISIFNPKQCLKKSIWVHIDEDKKLCGFVGFDSTTAKDLEVLSGPNGKFSVNDAQANIIKMNQHPNCQREISLCLAHLRNKIYNVLDYHPEIANELLTKIRNIYKIERKAKENRLSLAKHLELRQKNSQKVMRSIYNQLAELYPDTVPQSKLHKVIKYALGPFKAFEALHKKGEQPERWLLFCTFLKDARIPVDNNLSERLLRIVAKWRDSSLWIGKFERLSNYCDLLTVLKTCELRSVNPLTWLQNVFVRLNSFEGPPPDSVIRDLIPGN